MLRIPPNSGRRGSCCQARLQAVCNG